MLMMVCCTVTANESAASTSGDISLECIAIETTFANAELEQLEAMEFSQLHWRVLRHFRLSAAYIQLEEKKRAREHLLAGLELVNAHLKSNPEDVNILLLGAMLDGQILLLQPWRYFHNGRRGLKRVRDAKDVQPNHPRIVLIEATAKVVLPGILGGSAKEAAEELRGALEADWFGQPFESLPLCHTGQWGQPDLLNWLGRAYAKLNQPEQAQAAYEKVFELFPNHHWTTLAVQGQGFEWSEE